MKTGQTVSASLSDVYAKTLDTDSAAFDTAKPKIAQAIFAKKDTLFDKANNITLGDINVSKGTVDANANTMTVNVSLNHGA